MCAVGGGRRPQNNLAKFSNCELQGRGRIEQSDPSEFSQGRVHPDRRESLKKGAAALEQSKLFPSELASGRKKYPQRESTRIPCRVRDVWQIKVSTRPHQRQRRVLGASRR